MSSLKELASEMNALPDKIRAERVFILTEKDTLTALNLQQNDVRKSEMRDIGASLTDDLKPKFKTVDLREAELNHRVKDNSEYQERKERIRLIQGSVDRAKIDIELNENRMSAIRNIIRLVAVSVPYNMSLEAFVIPEHVEPETEEKE